MYVPTLLTIKLCILPAYYMYVSRLILRDKQPLLSLAALNCLPAYSRTV